MKATYYSPSLNTGQTTARCRPARYGMPHDLEQLLNRTVVLDTAGSILFLGVLKEITPGGFWLADADVHDCREGHASKEAYLIEAKRNGITPNRRRAFVVASTVISGSALDDVIAN